MSGIKFSNTTPVAPSGKSLVTFQADGQGNISAAYTAGTGGGGVNSQTTNYTMDATDDGKIVSMNGSSLTVKVPASPPSATWKVFIENLNATALTIDRNGKNIDGAGTNLSIPQNSGVYLATDGSNYFTERGVSSSGTVTHTGSLTADQVVVGNGTADIKILASAADATKFLNGDTTPAYAQVKDSDLALTNITTNNVSTSKHGFAPILPNVATSYLDGTGAYSVPTGGAHIAAGSIVYPIYVGTASPGSWANFTIFFKIGGRLIYNMAATWTFSVVIGTHTIAIDEIKILRCALDSTTVVDRTVVTFGSSTTPTWAVGNNTSDTISLQLDASHDYYIAYHVLSTANATATLTDSSPVFNNVSANLNSGYITTNHVDDATIPALTTGHYLVNQVLAA